MTLTITAAEVAELPPPGGGMRARVDQATTRSGAPSAAGPQLARPLGPPLI